MNESLITQVEYLKYLEKAALHDYLVISLAEDKEYKLSQEQKYELDESYAEYLQQPDSALDWEKARAEIFKLP